MAAVKESLSRCAGGPGHTGTVFRWNYRGAQRAPHPAGAGKEQSLKIPFAQCDLSFVCQQAWSALPEPDSAHFRHCGTCDKGVFPVRTRTQLDAALAVGRCVALTDDNEIVGWIGQSDFDWMAEQSETIELRIRHPLDAALENRLRMAFPKVESLHQGCPADTWIAIGTFSAQVAAVLTEDLLAHFPEVDVRIRSDQAPG